MGSLGVDRPLFARDEGGGSCIEGVMNHHRRPFPCVAALSLLPLAPLAFGCGPPSRSAADNQVGDKERAVEELTDATSVVHDTSGEIPSGERERSRCVVVVPSIVSGGLFLGARHGHGVVTCRTAERWSGPVFVTLSGGSAGLQIGIESADLMMLVRNERGMAQLFRSSFQLGADTSVAAGPTGRAAEASTDVKLNAEILSYAHSRGLFVGVELSGTSMKQDGAATTALYGANADVHAILTGELPPPPEAKGFLDQIGTSFPRSAESARPLASRAP